MMDQEVLLQLKEEQGVTTFRSDFIIFPQRLIIYDLSCRKVQEVKDSLLVKLSSSIDALIYMSYIYEFSQLLFKFEFSIVDLCVSNYSVAGHEGDDL